MWSNQSEIRVFSGICPDEDCRTKLFFPSYAASSIECSGCGKHFNKETLNSVQLIQDSEEALRSLLRSVLLSRSALRKGTDLVKVRGYSNYHCRILSPIFTLYGVEKVTWKAKLLQEMGQGEVFDCSHLGDKAFSIEYEYLETPGYGMDKSGSSNYLQGLFEIIQQVNDRGEMIVPLHVDGDGHCLVHAISRALTGREIFWHALMTNLQRHFKDNFIQYKNLFVDFIGQDEWDLIISEADPEFEPQDDQPLGLRNIHIFGLANILHRPILLLDSISGIQSSADYTGTFLPALVPEHLCRTKDGKHIPPLAIAWSSSGRNHYIPLVNLRNKPAAKVPRWVVPKAWGIPNDQVKVYIDFDSNDTCVIGGSKGMNDAYIQHLMKAMDEKFLEINHVSASLVTEVHQFVFKPSGVVGVKPKTVIERTRQTVEKEMLLRCLSCTAVCEYQSPVNQEYLLPGGHMYRIASDAQQGRLSAGELYSFPENNVICTYNAEKDVLEVVKYKGADVSQCVLCKGSMRAVKPDGLPIYRNGDRTSTLVGGTSRCSCGFKHFWDGKEYENQPEILPVSLEWGGKTIKDNVYWFQYESDQSLNSNVYSVAGKLVQKHFPGEFGSERLVQKVVDTILRQTAKKEGNNKGARPDIPNLGASSSKPEDSEAMMFTPSKMILTGQKKKTFHKEELNKSDAERRVKIKTEHHAPLVQNKQSKLQKTPEKSPGKTQVSKPETSPSSPRPTTPRSNKRIRLSSSTGGQHDLNLPLDATYNQLQEAIERELGIPSKSQKIRYGFPPQLLQPPEDGKEQEAIPVQHNERLIVEELTPPEPTPKENQDIPKETNMDVGAGVGASAGAEEVKNETSTENKAEEPSMDVDVDTTALASALMSALSGAIPSDMWDVACKTPQMFEKDGYYYNLAFRSLGALQDDQHCTMPNIPNKVFAYNKEKDRLDLCLGKIHVPVQPINQEMANAQRSSHQMTPVINTEASFSGAITNRHTTRTPMAFMGQGRSLLDSSPVSPRQPDKQQELTSTESNTTMTSTSVTSGSSTNAALSSQLTQLAKESTETTFQDNQNYPIEQPAHQSMGDSSHPSVDLASDAKMTNIGVVESNLAKPIAMETTEQSNEQQELPVSLPTSSTVDLAMEKASHISESPTLNEEHDTVAGVDSMEVDQEMGILLDNIPIQAAFDQKTKDETAKNVSTGNPIPDSSLTIVGPPGEEFVKEPTDIAMGEDSETKYHSIEKNNSEVSQELVRFNEATMDSITRGNSTFDSCAQENQLGEKQVTEESLKNPEDSSVTKETEQLNKLDNTHNLE